MRCDTRHSTQPYTGNSFTVRDAPRSGNLITKVVSARFGTDPRRPPQLLCLRACLESAREDRLQLLLQAHLLIRAADLGAMRVQQHADCRRELGFGQLVRHAA